MESQMIVTLSTSTHSWYPSHGKGNRIGIGAYAKSRIELLESIVDSVAEMELPNREVMLQDSGCIGTSFHWIGMVVLRTT